MPANCNWLNACSNLGKLGNTENSSGMGLYIVKDLVQSFNGEISLASELGKGTTFTISLPQEMIIS